DSRTDLVYQNLHVRVDKLATWASAAGDIDQIRRGVIQDGVSILREPVVRIVLRSKTSTVFTLLRVT
ncbi:MAG: hypothetical protein JWP44_4903, partial [Mucilaginibacter sp.]|nr:hypothetical protein [Mucilaginibacter sp.]